MKYILFVFLFGLAFSSQNAHSSNSEQLSMKGANAKQMSLFLSGVAQGIANMSVIIQMTGEKPPFCVPLDRLSGKFLYSLLSDNLEGPFDANMLATASVQELRIKYPCK